MRTDLTCDLCGNEFNPIWMAPHELWMEVTGDKNAFWCIPCFTTEAFQLGYRFCWVPIIRIPDDQPLPWQTP